MSESELEKKPKRSLLSIYVWGFILSCLALIASVFEYINNPFYLILPIAPIAYILYRIIKSTNKTERDVIKSWNDSILFLISFITTCLLTFKTIDHLNFDVFDEVMKEQRGYYLICVYAILFSIKTSISICEAIENSKTLREISKPKL
ncbi:hypothetical protein ACR9HA_23320 [Enterobacter ludwigii]